MAELEFFLVVESISVDQGTNRLSLFHMLDVVEFDSRPAFLPQLVAASAWNISPEEADKILLVTLRVHTPSGKSEPEVYKLTLEPAKTPRRRAFIGIEGYEFTEPGDWRFEMLLNGEHQANHRITVVFHPSPEAARTEAEANP